MVERHIIRNSADDSSIPTQLVLNFEINDVSSSRQCAETAAAHSHHNQEEAKHEGEEVWPSAGNML